MNYDFLNQRLKALAEESRLRTIPHGNMKGIDLCSNDYMGLASRFGEFMPEFTERFADAQMTSSASRLLSGNQKYHRQLENHLDSVYGKSNILFNSGYHANVGTIQAMAAAGAVFVCDKLVHASVIDGLRCGNARFLRFRHNDSEDAARQLKKIDNGEIPVIVTESIFSMDGDEAPLEELVEVKKSHPQCMLYLDEAHAIGVRGPKGAGLAAEKDLIHEVDILIGTFGKAVASSGAFVCSDKSVTDWLVNNARSLIFSTALPPANAAWTLLMIEKLASMDAERENLKRLSERLRSVVSELSGEENPSTTQIIPLITHDSEKAIKISSELRDRGICALPIRRPTVPPGGERIRFSLNASLTLDDIDKVSNVLRKIFN